MTVGSNSINNTEKNEQLELSDNRNLVDYEIKSDNKYRKTKKQSDGNKSNEL